MFKIENTLIPKELTKTNIDFRKCIKNMSVKDAYQFYKNNKRKYLYNTEETKKEYISINHRRCSFCSKYISEFEKEMTIEHIELKSEAPYKIFEWDNLLCSCKTCNTKRSTKKYLKNHYLDPRKINNISNFFRYSSNGTINPGKSLCTEDEKKAQYMIDLYCLNRKELIYERRNFYENMLDSEFSDYLIKIFTKDNFHIVFLSIYNYIILEK